MDEDKISRKLIRWGVSAMPSVDRLSDAQKDALLDLAALANAHEGIAETFRAFAARLLDCCGFDFAALAIAEDDPRYLRIVNAYPVAVGPGTEGASFRATGLGLPGTKNDPDGIEFVPAELGSTAGDLLAAAGYARAWSVALVGDGEFHGFLNVARTCAEPLDGVALEVLRQAARMLGSAVHREAQLSAARRETVRAQLLNEVAGLINAGEPVRAIFDRLAMELPGCIAIDYFGLFGREPDGDGFALVAEHPVLARETAVPVVDDDTMARIDEEGGLAEYRPDRIPGAGDRLQDAGLRRAVDVVLHQGAARLGAITVARHLPFAFGAADKSFLRLLGGLLAQALSGAQRVQAADLASARARMLNELALLLNAGEGVDALFDRLTMLLGRAIDFDHVSVLETVDEQSLRRVGSLPAPVREPNAILSRADIALDEVLAAGRPVIQYSINEMMAPVAPALKARGFRRLVSAPLQSHGEVLGLLSIARRSERRFTAEECAFVETVATLLAQSVANRKRLERAETEAARSRILNDIAVLLNAGEPPETFVGRITAPLRQVVPFERIALFVVAESGDAFHVFGGLRRESSDEGDLVSFRDAAFNPARVAPVNHVQYRTAEYSGGHSEKIAESGMVRGLTAYLRKDGELLGLFCLGRESDTPFSDDQVAFIDLLATLLAQAIANGRQLARKEIEAHRSQALNRVSLLLNSGEPLDDLWDDLRGLLAEGVAHDFCSLVTRDESPSGYRVRRTEALVLDGQPVDFDEAGFASIASHGSHMNQYDTATGVLAAPRAMFAAGFTRGLSMNLHAGSAIQGIFTLARRSNVEFSPQELAFVDVVGTLIAYAEANHQRIAESAGEALEQRIIADAAAAAAREGNEAELIRAVRDPIARFVSKPFVSFGFLEGEYTTFTDQNNIKRAQPVLEFSRKAMASGQAWSQRYADEVDPEVGVQLRDWGVHAAALTAADSGGAVLGLLFVGSRDPGYAFDDRGLRLLRILAQILGPALSNARAAAREREEANEQRVILEVAAAAARETAPGVLVQAVREPLRAIVPRPFVAFGFLEGDELVYPRADGTSARWPVGEDDRRTLAEGQVHGPAADLDPATRFGAWGPTVTAKTIAMSGGNVIGILLAASREVDFAFEERHLRCLRLMAQIIGPAMENARAAERAKDDAAEQRILADVAAAAARESEPDALLAAIAAPVGAIVPGALVAFSHREGDELVFSARGIGAPVRLPFGASFIEAEEQGQAVLEVTPEYLSEHRAALWTTGQTIITTARAGGTTTGFLSVASRVPDFKADERQLRQLRLVAQVVGPAMESAHAIAATARQEALYSLMLGSLSEGVILVDSNGRSIFSNRLGHKIAVAIDPRAEAYTPTDMAALLPEDVRTAFIEAMLHGVGSRSRTSLVIEGELTWFDYELVPLDHPTMRLLVVATDVTAVVGHEAAQALHREQIERASRLAALGELVGGVAHELNNPLTAILGFTEILAMNNQDGPAAEELGIIQKEALRARNIVRDLLFIARPGATERTSVSLAEVVAHIGRLRRTDCLRTGISFETSVTGECLAWGNEHQLTQVLLNLVTNAEQALAGLPGKEIRITAESDGDTTSLVVADTGIGMDAATLDRVFEPFFTTKHGQGTGLGLSLSYSIAKSHGGDLRVESSPGKGSRFIVTLPARAPEPVVPALAPGAQSEPARVLVIDDEPSLRKVCQRLLKSMGHQCETAAGSAAAIALVEGADFDVVLCDYRLASETANEVIEGFLRVAPRLVERTIIATGATNDAGVLELTQRYGLRLIAKPYGAEDLARVIRPAI